MLVDRDCLTASHLLPAGSVPDLDGEQRRATSILCCSYEFPPLGGGGSHVVAGLARHLADLDCDIDIVTMGGFDLPAREVVGGARLHRVGRSRRKTEICHPPEMALHLLRAHGYLRRLAARRHYDVNHTHFIFPDGVLAWHLRRRIGLRYVVTAHGSDVPGYNPDRFVGLHRWLAPLWQRVVRDADMVVCPSRHLQRLVLAAAPEARTAVIPNGIDVSRFRLDRQRQPAILVVARLLERKGVQHLLEALHERAYAYTVHIVGEGPARTDLERMAQASQTPVRFWGWLDNGSERLRQLFETSQIFIYPSTQENFPVALLEAMAAGLAIVTTKGTGCAEVVGDSALLVRPGSPGDIRAALDRLTTDPGLCAANGSAARTRLERHFAWAAVARQYRDVLVPAQRSL
jgi:glycosyltransferase involved in cell wall biosynthesis